MHYKVQKHLRLYNSHNMVPQIKSQGETQQWDWFPKPAVSLSKSDEKKANVQVFILWIIGWRVSFSRNNSSHIISHILFTLLIYQLCHSSLSPFPFFLFVFLLLLLVSIHLMSLHVPLPFPKITGPAWPQLLSLSACLENISFIDFLWHENSTTSSVYVKMS